MRPSVCVCSERPPLRTRTEIVVVMHVREQKKTTSTAPLALSLLSHHQLRLHGARGERTDLSDLRTPARRLVVLFPGEGSVPLDAEFVARDARPVTLVVPDGNWRQASRAARRLPGLEQAERVHLPPGRATEWGIRQETKAFGLATFEAIARALGILESADIEIEMAEIFRRMVAATLRARGEAFELESSAPRAESRTPLSILYEDADCVVVDKPSGMAVHRTPGLQAASALQTLRDQLGQWVYPVHRLDRSTSGALVFAKSPESARLLSQLFETRTIKKTYLALCRGHDPHLTSIDHPLTDSSGIVKPARTTLRLLNSWGRYGLYEVTPLTGRTHQIRRHLKHVSHPLIGDVRYGKGEHNRYFREAFDFRRLALHAAVLEFMHPKTREPLTIEAPLPGDFVDLLRRLEGALQPDTATTGLFPSSA